MGEKTAVKVFESLTPKMICEYNIVLDKEKNALNIHLPAYIKIKNPIKIEQDEIVTNIISKKIWVTLLRNSRIMHVTVF